MNTYIVSNKIRSPIFHIYLLTSGLILLGGCKSFQRTAESGYGPGYTNRMERTLLDPDSRKYAYELGFDPTREMSEDKIRQIQMRRDLRILERKMNSEKEKEQYSRVLPYLFNDDEKIHFLSIPSVEGRSQWAQSQGVWARAREKDLLLQAIAERGDVSLGMNGDHVRKAWGDPSSIDISGDGLFKNERWTFQTFQTTTDGFKKELRNVYFEGGRVVGWDTR
ncbi:MAG TPA: hypothetical protein PLU50_08090 [Pseudobdellovibrionaceae bacterium]|nr:hypothetical protein [Pseudobdellovibrionaceae bacterium]